MAISASVSYHLVSLIPLSIPFFLPRLLNPLITLHVFVLFLAKPLPYSDSGQPNPRFLDFGDHTVFPRSTMTCTNPSLRAYTGSRDRYG